MLATWNGLSTLDKFLDSWNDPLYTQDWGIPVVGIDTSDTSVTVTVDVPGVKAENLDVTLDKRILTISGKRGSKSFVKSFSVPKDIDDTGIVAKLDSGVLTVELPRLPKTVPKKIPIMT